MPSVRRCSPGVACLALVCAFGCSRTFDLAADAETLDASFTVPEAGVEYLTPLEAGPAFAVLGAQPSHGPFTGGTRIELRGRGFGSNMRVRVGTQEVAAWDILARDPMHLQIVTPPGAVGAADIVVENVATSQQARLADAFAFDAFYLTPSTGGLSGGTRVAIHGLQTQWQGAVAVHIDGSRCTDPVVTSATELACTTTAGTQGSKSVTITTSDGATQTVRDAFTYADSTDGYRGGLSGGSRAGALRVLALGADGKLLAATAVVIANAEGVEQRSITSNMGVAEFASPPPGPLTITLAKKCFSPVSYVGSNAATVTAYLDPVLSAACIPPDARWPMSGANGTGSGQSRVRGELVWPYPIELHRGPWTGVAAPRSVDEQRVAYVFTASTEPTARFVLPERSRATTEQSEGEAGYAFDLTLPPGNATLYAIAGIERQPEAGPRSFEPYVFGMVRGVAVPYGGSVDGVLIAMNGAFSRTLSLSFDAIPQGLRGPDRLRTDVAIDTHEGFLLLPYASREDLLPLPLGAGGRGTVRVGPLPTLVGPLQSAHYSVGAQAVTGGVGGAPSSTVLRQRARDASQDITVGPFVPIVRMLAPAAMGAWSGRVVQFALPEGAADLLVLGIESADGSMNHRVYVRGDVRTFSLPTFAQTELALPPGPITVAISAAKIADFRFDELQDAALRTTRWSAYSYDSFVTMLEAERASP